MTLKPSTRTFPKLVIKEWPEAVITYTVDEDCPAQLTGQGGAGGALYTASSVVCPKALSDFTRVVDQTGILKP